MQNGHFIVKYLPIKNCFVQVPNFLLRQISTEVAAVALNYGDKTFYLSASKSQPSPNEYLCMSSVLGKYLNIKEGSQVSITFVPDPPALTKVSVVPLNSEDWQIIHLQAEKIQWTMLDQISMVSPGQPLVIWLSKYMTVTLLIESISPSFLYGKLENYTEVHVQDAKDHKTPADTIAEEITSHLQKNETDCEIFLKLHKMQHLPPVFRVCLVPSDKKYGKNNLADFDTQISSPHNIFLRFSQLNQLFPERQHFSMTYGRIETIFKDKQSTNLKFTLSGQEYEPKKPEAVIVSLSPAEEYFNQTFLGENDNNNIWMSEALRTTLNVHLGSKIHIEPLNITDNPITSIDLFSNSPKLTAENSFRNYVKQYSTRTDLLLTQNSKIKLQNESCKLKLTPESSPYVLLNEEKLKSVKIEVTEPLVPEDSVKTEESSEKSTFSLENLYSEPIDGILKESLEVLEMSLSSSDFQFDRENILICGDVGTGKTTILHCLQRTLKNPPHFFHTELIDCKTLKGKKADIVSKYLTSVLHECVLLQPSVLFLDNLESITSFPADNEETSPDALNAIRISEVLSHLFTVFQSEHLISVVASSTQMERLGPGLKSSRGTHVFRTVLKTPVMNSQDRIDFIKFVLTRKVPISEDINWDGFREKTGGWVFQDLVDLSEKAKFIAWKRKTRGSIVVSEEDLVKALGSMKPLSLYGVSLYTGEGHCWSDIGGLEDVKESLKQLLQWPLIYSKLFANAPVRHQSGILLYGMPGTGKTMLAGAIAKECGLNFVNIKGPELLSKYIGASEEAVRGVFEKAQRIKPCVVFFDEFESLAPRRGHDSTGVTDRVVNQLLTQFDGVEGREGVAIVAASSRPDLLDPALLRPGRLDKSLLCPLPDEQTRVAILDTLCKSSGIGVEDLDLGVLGRMTSGFTGADLSAVLTQARLDAVEAVLEQAENADKSFEGVKITQEMLVKSCQATQPSLTAEEISKFSKIYNRFSRGENFSEDLLRNPKATLA